MIVQLQEYQEGLNDDRTDILSLKNLSDEDFITAISKGAKMVKAMKYIRDVKNLKENLEFIQNMQLDAINATK